MRVGGYTCKNVYSYTILDEESEFTFTFPQKSADNIFKMSSLSVKRSIANDKKKNCLNGLNFYLNFSCFLNIF